MGKLYEKESGVKTYVIRQQDKVWDGKRDKMEHGIYAKFTGDDGSLIFDAEKEADFAIENINRHLKASAGYNDQQSTQLNSSFLVKGEQVDSLSVDKLLAGIIAVDNIFLGGSQFELNGLLKKIIIKDEQVTPVTRVEIGSFGAGAFYGLKVWDASGALKFQVSDTTFIDGAIISNATIIDAAILDVDGNKLFAKSVDTLQIANNAIDTLQLANSAITNIKIDSNAVDTLQIANSAIHTLQLNNLAVTNLKIDDVTIDTGKHVANSITESVIDTGGTVTWRNRREREKTIVTERVATGGVDVIVLFSCNILYAKGHGPASVDFTLRYKRAGVTQRTLKVGLDNGNNTPITLVYSDTGTTGTHTLSVTGEARLSSTSRLNVTVPTVTYLILKT